MKTHLGILIIMNASTYTFSRDKMGGGGGARYQCKRISSPTIVCSFFACEIKIELSIHVQH